MNAIEIKKVSLVIGENTILKEVEANISKGKITGLLGPSGAGKTTLYKSILGLRAVTSGSITVLGKDSHNNDLHDNIGYMTQSPSVYFDLTVLENLNYFAKVSGASTSQISDLLDAVDLNHRKDSVIKNLSGGEKTRVSLITALLGDPEVLLLDEPTVGLDPVLREKLWSLFRQYAKNNRTVIVTSHMMDEAENCDDILFIRDGHLIAKGSKSDVLKQGNATSMEKAFLHLAKEDL
jgi:ABC-2 type transport system ATP-binding protein